jgi:hypothetical protein
MIDYLEIPNNMTMGVVEHDVSIAMAGRNQHSDILWTYQRDYAAAVNIDLYFKNIPPGSSSLRMASDDNDVEFNFQQWLLSDRSVLDESVVLHLQVYDLSGRRLMEKEGTAMQVKNEFSLIKDGLATGIYLASVISQDNSINTNGKIIIGH